MHLKESKPYTGFCFCFRISKLIMICKGFLVFSRGVHEYLEPAATLDPLLLNATCVALVVNRVRMPSGSPSGNVWICTVLLEPAVTSLPFCGGKPDIQSKYLSITDCCDMTEIHPDEDS